MSDLAVDRNAPPASTADEVLARVSDLVPVLHTGARDTEIARHMLPENLQALTDAGVFRLMTAREHGGFEADVSAVAAVLAKISEACPSTGWMCTLITAASWWPGILPEAGAEEIFSTPDLRVSSVLQPGGTATVVEGGVRLSGSWRWNTAGRHSNWTAMAALPNTGADAQPIMCFTPTDTVSPRDDWDACGMAGTATNSVTADDVFVPTQRIVPMSALFTGGYADQGRYRRPYYSYPAVQVFTALSVPAFVGMARGAMQAWKKRSVGRGITYTHYTDQAQSGRIQLGLAEAARELECAEMFAEKTLDTLERNTGSTPPTGDRILTRTYLGWCARAAQSCINTLYSMSGASAAQHSVDIQRYWRDVNALILHAAIEPSVSDELYGRWLLGVEPQTELF